MAPGLCIVSLNPGNCKRCECGGGWYCSRACQKHDWAISEEPHRDVCPLHTFKGVCDSYHIPRKLREMIVSFIIKPAHGCPECRRPLCMKTIQVSRSDEKSDVIGKCYVCKISVLNGKIYRHP